MPKNQEVPNSYTCSFKKCGIYTSRSCSLTALYKMVFGLLIPKAAGFRSSTDQQSLNAVNIKFWLAQTSCGSPRILPKVSIEFNRFAINSLGTARIHRNTAEALWLLSALPSAFRFVVPSKWMHASVVMLSDPSFLSYFR
jgi:hypothetical protein